MPNKPFEIQDGIKIQTGDDILNSTGTSAFAGAGSELEIDGGNANTPELGELLIDGNGA